MIKEVKQAPYIDWKPAISAEDVYKSTVGFQYLHADTKGNAFWVENRPNEGGRSVLVWRNPNGFITDLTPSPYSVRTRVFEYGSAPYTTHEGWVYFANFKDQRLYKQHLEDPEKIIPVTPESLAGESLRKYAEVSVSPDGKWMVFAYEVEPKAGGHPNNYIAVIDLQSGVLQEPRIITSGADFYAKPKFSNDGSKLAWLEWDHPYMRWDSTRLFLAEFKDGELIKDKKTKVAGSDDSSISDFIFDSSGTLFFSADFANRNESSFENYYNIYAFKEGKAHPITKDLGEYWSIRAVDEKLLCLYMEKGRNQIFLLDPLTGAKKLYANDYVDFGVPVYAGNGDIFVHGLTDTRPSEILRIDNSGGIQVLRKSARLEIDESNISRPEPIDFPTQDGKTSYGYFYLPVNSKYKSPPNEKPPVRVLVHGGPTGATSEAFNLSKLFWTSQGFAVFDVNYRGSIGYGRQYRDALKHKWGILDIQDVKDGLDYLQKKGLISDQAVISGGSAGGYTVQRILTYYPNLMSAGASHFGIGNLVTLQKLTHKLESHYLEQLIGGTLETNIEEYTHRSPINHIDKLKAPMIIFQGSEDKVVPPENSREMARVLKKKGVEHEYYEYEGEEHGFRKKENLIDSLMKESLFLKRVLSRQSKDQETSL